MEVNSKKNSIYDISFTKFCVITLFFKLIYMPKVNACTHDQLSGTIILGKSNIGQICTLLKVIENKKIQVIARSYDGKGK